MIGIFDSGSGGLTFLAAMQHRFPGWSYLYYADYEHCPFGDKSPEEIQKYTYEGVVKLFDAGATIVILACNTASAWTLRQLQTELLPGKPILGVTIPGAEKVVELGCKYVTVFATQQTVKSRTYAERVRILDPETVIEEVALSGDLVRAIELLLPVHRCHTADDFKKLTSLYQGEWQCDGPEWENLVGEYFSHVPYNHLSEGILLGCTHYSYLKKSLQKLFPGVVIIDPSEEAALKLSDYIMRHSISPTQGKEITFL